MPHAFLLPFQYLNDELGLGSLYELLADRMLADRPSDPMQHVIDTVLFVKQARGAFLKH